MAKFSLRVRTMASRTVIFLSTYRTFETPGMYERTDYEIGLQIEEEGIIPEDETIMHAENTEVLKVPAQQEIVSYPPLLNFDDALPCDEKEEEDKFSNLSNLACYDTDSDIVDNIDEFIHVGRRRWDIVGYDLDPIYDTESHFQLFPLQLSQQMATRR